MLMFSEKNGSENTNIYSATKQLHKTIPVLSQTGRNITADDVLSASNSFSTPAINRTQDSTLSLVRAQKPGEHIFSVTANEYAL